MTGVAFTSAGVAAAGTESPRAFFRRFLAERVLRGSDLNWYFDQALPHFGESDEVRLAVEEIVDRLARLVGFDVAREDEASHAVWTSPGGHQMLVWVLDRATAVWLEADIDTLVDRVRRRSTRPLLKGRDPRKVLSDLAELRNPVYALAPIHVRSQPSPHDATVKAILKALSL